MAVFVVSPSKGRQTGGGGSIARDVRPLRGPDDCGPTAVPRPILRISNSGVTNSVRTAWCRTGGVRNRGRSPAKILAEARTPRTRVFGDHVARPTVNSYRHRSEDGGYGSCRAMLEKQLHGIEGLKRFEVRDGIIEATLTVAALLDDGWRDLPKGARRICMCRPRAGQ